MRTAEISGASVAGFGAGKGKAERHRRPSTRRAAIASHFRFSLSPLTQAVALTAVIAASLFVIYDTVRTFQTTREELALIGAA